MPKNLDDLLLFAVDTSGLDLADLTRAAGGLRDASGQLVRLARPVSRDAVEQASRTLSPGSKATAFVGVAVIGVAVGVAVSENRRTVGRKVRGAWRRARGGSTQERSYDPWREEPAGQSDGIRSDARDLDARLNHDAPRRDEQE